MLATALYIGGVVIILSAVRICQAEIGPDLKWSKVWPPALLWPVLTPFLLIYMIIVEVQAWRQTGRPFTPPFGDEEVQP